MNSGDGEWTSLRSLPTGTQGEPAPIDIDIDISANNSLGEFQITEQWQCRSCIDFKGGQGHVTNQSEAQN